jgi:putative oxidoreductase
MRDAAGSGWNKEHELFGETTMIEMLISTKPDLVRAIARCVLGLIFFAHGAQKILGWYGGPGFNATFQVFTKQLRIPAGLAVLVMSAELFGGLGLVVGLLSRIAALGIALTMFGAVLMVHRRHGLFMNWYGNQEGQGFEYHLLAIALAIVVTVKGGGAFSIDHFWYDHLRPAGATIEQVTRR